MLNRIPSLLILLVVASSFCTGCAGEPEFVDPRDPQTTGPAEARSNIQSIVQTVRAMLKDGDQTGAVEYCKEQLPTLEGYCEPPDGPHAAIFKQILGEGQAAAAGDDLESHLAKIEELATQLPEQKTTE